MVYLDEAVKHHVDMKTKGKIMNVKSFKKDGIIIKRQFG